MLKRKSAKYKQTNLSPKNVMGYFVCYFYRRLPTKDVLDSDGFEKMVELRRYWRLCSKCEILTPPLSWHCESCDTCILKRDHHCVFTGCCVGHRNQRYFLRFIVHIILGTFYALCYNSAYFWWLHKETFLDLGTAVKMICPFMTFLAEFSWTNIYLVIYEINVIALIYTGVLLFFQGSNILKGAVSYHERQTAKYDMGWRKNLIIVMGNRWRLVWLWAFLDSKLPHNVLPFQRPGKNYHSFSRQSQESFEYSNAFPPYSSQFMDAIYGPNRSPRPILCGPRLQNTQIHDESVVSASYLLLNVDECKPPAFVGNDLSIFGGVLAILLSKCVNSGFSFRLIRELNCSVIDDFTDNSSSKGSFSSFGMQRDLMLLLPLKEWFATLSSNVIFAGDSETSIGAVFILLITSVDLSLHCKRKSSAFIALSFVEILSLNELIEEFELEFDRKTCRCILFAYFGLLPSKIVEVGGQACKLATRSVTLSKVLAAGIDMVERRCCESNLNVSLKRPYIRIAISEFSSYKHSDNKLKLDKRR
uniref:Palmitoyltransferase n=1 Tax=Glossina palpalis gambiensis TaxID=67801 RepID=A0A1B0C063_9MUSC